MISPSLLNDTIEAFKAIQVPYPDVPDALIHFNDKAKSIIENLFLNDFIYNFSSPEIDHLLSYILPNGMSLQTWLIQEGYELYLFKSNVICNYHTFLNGLEPTDKEGFFLLIYSLIQGDKTGLVTL